MSSANQKLACGSPVSDELPGKAISGLISTCIVLESTIPQPQRIGRIIVGTVNCNLYLPFSCVGQFWIPFSGSLPLPASPVVICRNRCPSAVTEYCWPAVLGERLLTLYRVCWAPTSKLGPWPSTSAADVPALPILRKKISFPSRAQTFSERFAVQILHYQEVDAVLMPDVMQSAYAGMIERRNRTSLALKALL